jgi:hypothetical protein
MSSAGYIPPSLNLMFSHKAAGASREGLQTEGSLLRALSLQPLALSLILLALFIILEISRFYVECEALTAVTIKNTV